MLAAAEGSEVVERPISFESFKEKYNLNTSDEGDAYNFYLIYLDMIFVKKLPYKPYNELMDIQPTAKCIRFKMNVPSGMDREALQEINSLDEIQLSEKVYVFFPVRSHEKMSIRQYDEILKRIESCYEGQVLDGMVVSYIDGDGTISYYRIDHQVPWKQLL